MCPEVSDALLSEATVHHGAGRVFQTIDNLQNKFFVSY